MILFKGLEYLWMLIFIMVVAGIAKEKNLFASSFLYLRNTVKSNRLLVFLISAIGGILPIEGRVTVSAGVLDTLTCNHTHGRKKMGIVDYLSTHHYYLWSPLEKTVILPLAAFGITYVAWIEMLWPFIIVTLAYIFAYVFLFVKEEDIHINQSEEFKISSVIRNVLPFFLALGIYIYTGGESNFLIIFGTLALYYCFLTQTWDYKKLLSYVNWSVVLIVAAAIILGNYFKSQEVVYKEWLTGTIVDPTTFYGMLTITLIGFISSFLMGSSGKYVAFAVLTSQIFGIQYFLWFFIVDYVGYLLSPTHKCIAVGNRYFSTPIKNYYFVLGGWCLLLLSLAGIFTFIIKN